MAKIISVDLFCGAGGEGTGMIQAFEQAGREYEMLAINHWDVAIETHSTNHPNVKHKCESIQNVDPLEAIPGGRVHFLWASPECTHHSNARGGRPKSDQSRASAWLVMKWVQELYIDRLYIENVPEFLDWGPIGANGEVLESKKGDTFRAFVNALEANSYRVDWQIMNAADYGAPTTRRRLILQAVRGKNKIVWPTPSHAAVPGLFNEQKWVAAREIIDWNISGTSIFDRKKPLADNTIKRIEAGIKKYWGVWAEPFLVILRGTGTNRSVDLPCPAVTAGGQHLGLVQPFITRYNGGDDRNQPINEPLSTVDCSNRFGVVEPFMFNIGQTSGGDRSRPISEPLSTIVTKAEHCIVSPFLVKYYGSGESICDIGNPVDTITCKDRFALVDGCTVQMDIRFRMFQPHELAAAQSFPVDYFFAGNKCDQVKQIGNAVPPKLAQAIINAALVA